VDHVAEAKWNKSMRVIERVAKGGRFDPKEYDEAASFLERSTCIFAGDDYSCLVGRIPGLLEQTIPRWKQWWAENRHLVKYNSGLHELSFQDGRAKCPNAS